MGAQALVWLLLVSIGAGFYVHNIRLNQSIRAYARHYCEQQGLQMLDQSAVLSAISWAPRNGFHLSRRYSFEFSLTGGKRYQGWITTTGARIVRTETQPVREDEFH